MPASTLVPSRAIEKVPSSRWRPHGTWPTTTGQPTTAPSTLFRAGPWTTWEQVRLELQRRRSPSARDGMSRRNLYQLEGLLRRTCLPAIFALRPTLIGIAPAMGSRFVSHSLVHVLGTCVAPKGCIHRSQCSCSVCLLINICDHRIYKWPSCRVDCHGQRGLQTTLLHNLTSHGRWGQRKPR